MKTRKQLKEYVETDDPMSDGIVDRSYLSDLNMVISNTVGRISKLCKLTDFDYINENLSDMTYAELDDEVDMATLHDDLERVGTSLELLEEKINSMLKVIHHEY